MANKNEIKINIPEGMEIDRENSTFECIKFKPIKKKLPKSWEEFCETHSMGTDECYFDSCSRILKINRAREAKDDRNVLPNKETAEAFLALMQLIQLRDCYNEGWQPNWKDGYEYKFTIINRDGDVDEVTSYNVSAPLAFKTAELRDQFLDNFRDLIEVAKPLI